ncbi:PQQ-binding-like beta-propeller repeat protein [Micromonospora sp. NPDC005252]|uniref:outer membrane protein assembly factor BamB family protein n=1 Tax=Micromonospora sp. NPDC005252 TaxID=3364228 RepID=UPI0036C41C12
MIFQIRWRRSLHQRPDPTAIASASDCVVVHERGTRLVCLDPVDGAARWDIPIGTWPRAVVVDGTQCWVISQDRAELRCLDLHTGAILWSADLSPFPGHVVVAGDRVLAGGWRGYTRLQAYDRWTGSPLWTDPQRTATVLPTVVGGQVLVGEPGGTSVRLLDGHDGGELFRWTLPEPLIAGDGQWPAFVTADADRVLLRCGARTVWQLQPAAGASGEFFRHDRDLAHHGIGVADATAWVPELRDGLVAVDLKTGTRLWRLDVGSDVAGKAVRVGAGQVVATRRPGMLMLVDHSGRPHARALVDKQLNGIRRLTPDLLLVLGKGTLAAVAVTG